MVCIGALTGDYHRVIEVSASTNCAYSGPTLGFIISLLLFVGVGALAFF
jgi:hypothetical protein